LRSGQQERQLFTLLLKKKSKILGVSGKVLIYTFGLDHKLKKNFASSKNIRNRILILGDFSNSINYSSLAHLHVHKKLFQDLTLSSKNLDRDLNLWLQHNEKIISDQNRILQKYSEYFNNIH